MRTKKNYLFDKRLLCIVLLFFWTSFAWAQTKLVNGNVKDVSGEAVIGASVVAKGTTIGTVTDVNGDFTLNVPTSAKTLTISFIGMETKDVAISEGTMNVILEENVVMLNEVVAIGYGTMKKSDLTGAISSVNSSKIAETGRTSAISALQGAVPGVQIQQASSQVGVSPSIIIRGQNSISGNTNPLYVVDGIVTSTIDFLNPQDIEKIDILKDASSTAIYGSRGADGVVIVTTKSGDGMSIGSKPVISYDGYYGVVNKTRMPDFMDSQQWMQYRTLAYQKVTPNAGDGTAVFDKSQLFNVWQGSLSPLNADGQQFFSNGTFSGSQFLLDRYLNNQSTNWADLITRTGQSQNHFISIAGNSQAVSYMVGIGYQDDKSIFINNDYTRYNLKGNLTAKLDNHWTTGFNISGAYSNLQTGGTMSMINAFRMSPVVSPYATNLDPALNTIEGNLAVVPGKTLEKNTDSAGNAIYTNSVGGGGLTSSVNPLIDLDANSNETRTVTAIGNAFLQYSPTKDLSFKTTFSPSVTTYRTGFYQSSNSATAYGNPPVASVETNTALSYTWDNQVNYKFTPNNKDHVFDVMGLWSVYSGNAEDYYTWTQGYNYDYKWYNLGAATSTSAGTSKVSSGYTEFALLSAAARLNYAYQDKYLATAILRADGSSKLAQGHKWAWFPSIALAWRISQESFLNDSKDWLSNLKVRASLGYTGNNNINPFQTQSLANVTTYYTYGSNLGQGTAIGALGSSDLSWEKTRELDFGLDFGFWHNRISGTVDYYNRLSTGLLQPVTLPLESGAGTMIENIGSVSNVGIEAALNAYIIRTNDFSWSANLTFAANKNKIVNLFGNTTPDFYYINSSTQKWIVGQNINSIYGYVSDGVWTASEIQAAIAAKDPRVVNASGTVIATEGQAKIKNFTGSSDPLDIANRRVQGHSDPSWTGGFGTTLTYKGFDLSANLYVAQGITMFSPFMEEFTNLYNDRGRAKLNVDYYIPAGTTVLDPTTGLFVSTTASNNSQTYPTPYSQGNYWHLLNSDPNNNLPGAWVNASYVKIRNIALGYTLPANVLRSLGINQLRIYCNVLNPFTFTNYPGFDPEWANASMNTDNGPSTITYQFGVNLKF